MVVLLEIILIVLFLGFFIYIFNYRNAEKENSLVKVEADQKNCESKFESSPKTKEELMIKMLSVGGCPADLFTWQQCMFCPRMDNENIE